MTTYVVVINKTRHPRKYAFGEGIALISSNALKRDERQGVGKEDNIRALPVRSRTTLSDRPIESLSIQHPRPVLCIFHQLEPATDQIKVCRPKLCGRSCERCPTRPYGNSSSRIRTTGMLPSKTLE